LGGKKYRKIDGLTGFQNGRAEIEERALVLRETTRNKDKMAKLLDDCIVLVEGRKRCHSDRVS
jgi:hypothetical protein